MRGEGIGGEPGRSIVGDLINFRGLVYAPLNENGVVFLFGKVAEDLNMYVEEIKPGFPDCIDGRFTGGPLAGKTVNIKWYAKHDGMVTEDLVLGTGIPGDSREMLRVLSRIESRYRTRVAPLDVLRMRDFGRPSGGGAPASARELRAAVDRSAWAHYSQSWRAVTGSASARTGRRKGKMLLPADRESA
jgi:hypothetical protein